MSSTRKNVLFITTSRSDFASVAPLIALMRKDKHLQPLLFATGDHYSVKAGETHKQIEAQGFTIDARHAIQSIEPAGQVGEVVSTLSSIIPKLDVTYAVVCGDRKETFAGAIACAMSKVPLFHIHGGDVTYGMIDDAMRHAITKLSSIHFPASPLSAKRVAQMGEEKWRIFMTGSPDTDGLHDPLPEQEALEEIGLTKRGYALLLLNPETLLDKQGNASLARAVTEALKKKYKEKVVVIYPNNDPSSEGIREVYDKLTDERFVIKKGGLPRAKYLALLKNAAFLIGNSSSGITEAATFKTPVINVGHRQDGREQSKNVVNAPQLSQISGAIAKVQSAAFLKKLKTLKNVYGNGGATGRMYKIMQAIDKKYTVRELLYKKFTLV